MRGVLLSVIEQLFVCILIVLEYELDGGFLEYSLDWMGLSWSIAAHWMGLNLNTTSDRQE